MAIDFSKFISAMCFVSCYSIESLTFLNLKFCRCSNSVVIEEILDDEKPADGNVIAKRGKKKTQFSTSYNNGESGRQLILKSAIGASILESEDEDGFPISSPQKNKADAASIKGKAGQNKDTRTDDESKKGAKGDRACVEILKRKVDAILQVGEQKRSASKSLWSH